MAIEIVDLPSYKMVIFHCYVSSPDGNKKHWILSIPKLRAVRKKRTTLSAPFLIGSRNSLIERTTTSNHGKKKTPWCCFIYIYIIYIYIRATTESPSQRLWWHAPRNSADSPRKRRPGQSPQIPRPCWRRARPMPDGLEMMNDWWRWPLDQLEQWIGLISWMENLNRKPMSMRLFLIYTLW